MGDFRSCDFRSGLAGFGADAVFPVGGYEPDGGGYDEDFYA